MEIKTIQVYENLTDIDFNSKNENEQIFVKRKYDNKYIDSFIIKNKYFKDDLIILNKFLESNIIVFCINNEKIILDNRALVNTKYLTMDNRIKNNKFIVFNNSNGIVIGIYFESNGLEIEITYNLIYDRNVKIFKVLKKIKLRNKNIALMLSESYYEFEDIVDFLMRHCDSEFKNEFLKYRKIIEYDVDDFIIGKDKQTYNLFKNVLIDNYILSKRTLESLFKPINTTLDGIDIIVSLKEKMKIFKVKNNKIYDQELNEDDNCMITYLIDYKYGNKTYIKPSAGSIINNDPCNQKVEKIYVKKGFFILKIHGWRTKEKLICFKYYNKLWMAIPENREDAKNLLDEYKILCNLTD